MEITLYLTLTLTRYFPIYHAPEKLGLGLGLLWLLGLGLTLIALIALTLTLALTIIFMGG